MLKKGAYFTDLHWGRRNNSEDHNKDCDGFIDWFISQVESDTTIDHIGFLGDWHEHRASINSFTLDYSYNAMKKLNSVGIPVYMILGNHDLGKKYDRSIFTTRPFEALTNINIINEPTIIKEIVGSALFCPYLFHEEYTELLKYHDVPIIFSHLELNGFIVTGETITMKHGPNHKDFFKKQKRVFSGHFHKRQHKDNIHYIGNTFPMDYSDANDNDRGMMVYDFEKDTINYKAWPNAPTYIKCKLSDIMDENNDVLKQGARVKCIVDIDITYSESIELKNILTTEFNLKELFFEEETEELRESLEETVINEETLNTESTSELVKSMLTQINNNNIDNDLLVKIYEGRV
jgi:DNA repair exonuclease SbcCD nuclease subunit